MDFTPGGAPPSKKISMLSQRAFFRFPLPKGLFKANLALAKSLQACDRAQQDILVTAGASFRGLRLAAL